MSALVTEHPALTEVLSALDAAGVRERDLLHVEGVTASESRTRVEFSVSGTILHVLATSTPDTGGALLVLTEAGLVTSSGTSALARARALALDPASLAQPDATNAAVRVLATTRARVSEDLVARFLEAAGEGATSLYPVSALLRGGSPHSMLASDVEVATRLLDALASGAPLEWVVRLHRRRLSA